MILVADNAPYHHKREIGSFAGLNKAKMVDLMVSKNVEYIDVPITNEPRRQLAELEVDEEHPDVQDRGDCVRIEFISGEQKKRASATNPRICTIEELIIAFVHYLKDQLPSALEC